MDLQDAAEKNTVIKIQFPRLAPLPFDKEIN